MKKWFLFLLLIPVLGAAQSIFTYTDYNGFIHAANNGYFSQIEHQDVSDMTLGDELIAYKNSQKDFKVYNGTQTKLLTNQMVDYKLSDHLLAWNIGSLLFYYENGVSHNITSFGGQYAVSDSLIVYQDTRYYTLNVIYQGKVIQLMQQTAAMYMPVAIGDNMVVFRDNGDVYKVFWQGEIYEIGVLSGTNYFQFSVGTNILAFNDPNTRTFAAFQNGAFVDVEDMQVGKMKACRGFVVYEDIQGNLKYYGNGEQKELASYYQFWDAKDDVVIWGESNSTYAFNFGKKFQLSNYSIKEWKLKNDVIAFRTNVSGVAAAINGQIKEITTLSNNDYWINGHGVLVQFQNKSVVVLNQGKLTND
jgi:hypothetical protein